MHRRLDSMLFNDTNKEVTVASSMPRVSIVFADDLQTEAFESCQDETFWSRRLLEMICFTFGNMEHLRNWNFFWGGELGTGYLKSWNSEILKPWNSKIVELNFKN